MNTELKKEIIQQIKAIVKASGDGISIYAYEWHMNSFALKAELTMGLKVDKINPFSYGSQEKQSYLNQIYKKPFKPYKDQEAIQRLLNAQNFCLKEFKKLPNVKSVATTTFSKDLRLPTYPGLRIVFEDTNAVEDETQTKIKKLISQLQKLTGKQVALL